jgi:3,4-dihydroxy 2-butanone 4-phosphate synthase/GTP cyclohydrolase II
MILSAWLKANKIQRYVFAARIGVTPSMITEYCDRGVWPRKEVMQAIVRETNGAVTANDFLDVQPDTQPQPEPAQ